jgi:hypothetical protein
MADNGSSGSMAAIVAIIAIVVIVGVGFVFAQNYLGKGTGGTGSINVELPTGQNQ